MKSNASRSKKKRKNGNVNARRKRPPNVSAKNKCVGSENSENEINQLRTDHDNARLDVAHHRLATADDRHLVTDHLTVALGVDLPATTVGVGDRVVVHLLDVVHLLAVRHHDVEWTIVLDPRVADHQCAETDHHPVMAHGDVDPVVLTGHHLDVALHLVMLGAAAHLLDDEVHHLVEDLCVVLVTAHHLVAPLVAMMALVLGDAVQVPTDHHHAANGHLMMDHAAVHVVIQAVPHHESKRKHPKTAGRLQSTDVVRFIQT